MTHTIQEFVPFADGWPDGPKRLVLIGPPGTGKTTALLDAFVSEYMDAVQRRERDTSRLLCCSFSNAAAQELRDRLAKQFVIPPEELRRCCSTMHSEALRIIREHLGPQKRYDGLTRKVSEFARGHGGDADPLADHRRDRSNVLRSAALDLHELARATLRSDNTPWLRGMARRIAAADAELRQMFDPRDTDAAPDALLGEIAAYEAEKRETGAVDFTDILTLAINCPAPERTLLILDEAQDCTPLLWKLFHHWGANSQHVVVVGDGDQAVHEWMGSDPSFIRDTAYGDSQGWEARALMRSYRVPAAQHSEARAIIRLISDRPDVPYASNGTPGEIVRLEGREEALAWLRKCTPERRGFVLTRANYMCAEWGKLLMASGLAAVGRGCPLSAPAKVWAFQALVALRTGGYADAPAWRHLAPMLPANTEFSVMAERGGKLKLIEALKTAGGEDRESGEYAGRLVREALGSRSAEWLSMPLEKCANALLRMDARYAAALSMIVESGGSLDPADAAVEVMTMHHSKGREADVVVIDATMPYAAQREYGFMYGSDAVDSGTDAERRLLYVAMTRSRRITVICGNRPWYPELVGMQ